MTKKSEAKNDTEVDRKTVNAEASRHSTHCGIIRPIADTDGYASNHWNDVGEILAESIKSAGFEPRLVSEADSVAVIHGTIVQNIFEDSIIVCDVSSRNPNVMFELGMRLAFDKPVVIVKDDATNYAFDTGVIEHIPYPKSLHYRDIGIFKEKLRIKILNTAEKAKDPGFSPFLKHFRNVSIQPQKLQNEDVPLNEYVISKLESMDSKINRITQQTTSPYASILPNSRRFVSIPAPNVSITQAVKISSIFDPNSVVTRRDNDLLVQTNLPNEEAAKIYKAVRLVDSGVPTDAAIGMARIESGNGVETPTSGNPYAYATETHQLPE
ncbi:Uncharacterised protein [Acinetobacter baumannii]|nr:Uncharacterised protein [Acinetobacter baumannii]